jgi:hypothetical protein
MKRYWLFQFDQYYPQGGMNDFVESFDSLEEALVHYKKLKNHFKGDYYHIFDSQNQTIISKWEF